MTPSRRVSFLPWPSRQQPEEGFTLVEVMVALGIVFATLLLLAFSMFSGFSAVSFSRQRTQASALANQTLELIRALPFDQLYMNQTDLAAGGDTQIALCTSPVGSYCFLNSAGRTIPAATFGSGTPTTPFFPSHITTQSGSPGTTTYTIKSYVTLDPTNSQTKIATVQVSWSPAVVGGVQNNVQAETKIYSSPFSEAAPGATTTTSTTAPPATHSWTASAQTQPGTISIAGSVLNVPVANVTFSLPTTSSYLQGRTTNPGSGTDVGPTGHTVTAGTASSGISTGGSCLAACTSAAFTPASPHTQSLAGAGVDGPYNVAATPGLLGSIPGNQSVGLNLLGSTLNAQVAAGSVTSAGAVAASTSSGGTLNVPSGSGVLPSTNLGYGKASATQTGVISSNLALTVAGLSALNLGLVSLTPTGNTQPDTSVVQQNGSAGVPLSQTYTAAAQSSFTSLSVLSGLPALGPLVQVNGFQSAASACAGPASCASATATESGTVTIAGIALPINLATASPGIVTGIGAVNVTTGILNVTANIGVTIGAHTATGTSSASVSSPVAITVALKITVLGSTVVNLNVAVNLGSLSTTASYS